MRLHQRRVQVGRKVRKAAYVEQGRHRDQDIHEDDQHIKLQHVGVYHAEQAGGGCVDHKDHCCDQRAHLIGEAELSPQHPDDRGRGGDLGGHRPHHGERDQHREGDLGCPANRRSNSSGIEVIPYCIPISEIFPAMPEKMNIPRRYGIAVRTALKPSV